MSAPSLRPLGPGDLPALVELCREHAAYERAGWVEHDREPGLRRWFLGDEGARCWVVDVGGVPVGFAAVNLELSTWDAGGYLHLDCLYLREPYRRQGLGRKLMAHVAGHARRLGAVNLQWQTPDWNVDAVRFYERLGATGKRKLRFTLDPDACRNLAT